MKNLIIISTFFIIFSCSHQVKKNENEKNKVTTEQKNNFLAFNGHYVFGAEVNTFKPCGSKKIFWVTGNTPLLNELAIQYQKIAKKPYEEIFIVISANEKLEKDNSDGFAADYDGLIYIEKIKSIKPSSSTDCN